MVGLIDIAGHAQTVRPLLAPMAEAAAKKSHGTLDRAQTQRVHALAAATDNVGRFFGEDVFLAFGAVLLIQGFFAEHGIVLEPLQIALWALPTAIAAFVIHAIRIGCFQRKLPRPRCRTGGTPMLRIEHFYWLLAALSCCSRAGATCASAASRTPRSGRLLALLFAAGEPMLRASKAGEQLPAHSRARR